MDPPEAGTHKPAPLTQRQKTVLKMVARGIDSREEAAAWWRQYNSPHEKISRRVRTILPASVARWLAFSAGSVAVAVTITAVIVGITRATNRGNTDGRPAGDVPETVVAESQGSEGHPGLTLLSANDISGRAEIAGVRLVPARTPALWDAQFIPQAGHRLTEVPDASALAAPLPFALNAPPKGYRLESAAFTIAADVQPETLVSGGARYVSPDSPHAVDIELHGVQDGKIVEVVVPGRGTASTTWKYTTPGGGDVLVLALTPGGGAEPVMEADVTRDGVYARISMPGLTLDAALAFLDDFMGG
jgi:hypothetical protein